MTIFAGAPTCLGGHAGVTGRGFVSPCGRGVQFSSHSLARSRAHAVVRILENVKNRATARVREAWIKRWCTLLARAAPEGRKIPRRPLPPSPGAKAENARGRFYFRETDYSRLSARQQPARRRDSGRRKRADFCLASRCVNPPPLCS